MNQSTSDITRINSHLPDGSGIITANGTGIITTNCVPDDNPAPLTYSFEAPVPQIPAKPRQVTIVPQGYGFLVTVGCQTLCIESVSKLVKALKSYLKDPVETERKYNEGKLFKDDEV